MSLSSIAGLDVSRETLERLGHYLELVKKWNPRINLISAKTLSEAENRHFYDSAQVFALLPKHAKSLVDFGSGGGFPGLVLAIIATELMPEMNITLIEADQRKASFLRTVLRETSVSATVIAKRIEQIEPLGCDVATARALAPLPLLCNFAYRHLQPSGCALFLKGKTWGKELEDAHTEWKFEYTAHTSQTDSDAVILHLRDLSHD
ncbi:16S rRNA (guanine527-N7)-methyltransferase [Sagittula marina]|uniref:Ribosomal RNA small subunit methyltransferase G n=1 Tax=Sagittula marina TaxID=943940 RepID=A0A7W6GPV5_9RHOB|nr:16S rRNA (guanine(527)-N(7))-methyltransferase RsmG [Sagittula marina]MBB3983746.1 16S rRNA (guanine527-N7)-methyltransferase [Sagittula marina]